jgi:putative SOS response-associated peptidase YedK
MKDTRGNGQRRGIPICLKRRTALGVGAASTFNALADVIETKPLFRDAFKHRCYLIPASSYYERKECSWRAAL